MAGKLYNVNNLTENHLRIITEALLFASTVDVCGNWYRDDIESMIDLAKTVRSIIPEVSMKNVYVPDMKDGMYYDESTEQTVKYFPELTNNRPIVN